VPVVASVDRVLVDDEVEGIGRAEGGIETVEGFPVVNIIVELGCFELLVAGIFSGIARADFTALGDPFVVISSIIESSMTSSRFADTSRLELFFAAVVFVCSAVGVALDRLPSEVVSSLSLPARAFRFPLVPALVSFPLPLSIGTAPLIEVEASRERSVDGGAGARGEGGFEGATRLGSGGKGSAFGMGYPMSRGEGSTGSY
jgi:hypothetical protein